MLHFVRRSLLVQLLSVYLLFVVIVLLGLTAQFTLSGEFGRKGKISFSQVGKRKERTMTATAIDSTVFRHIFSSEPMRQVFSDENRVQCYLDIEAALARVQARLGLIPQRAADEITAKCTLDIIDMAQLKSKTELIGYPVLPVVQQLVAACADHLGEYCHWGATTQDITDTATIMQIRQALSLIEDDLAAISGHLADLARRYRDTPMAG